MEDLHSDLHPAATTLARGAKNRGGIEITYAGEKMEEMKAARGQKFERAEEPEAERERGPEDPAGCQPDSPPA